VRHAPARWAVLISTEVSPRSVARMFSGLDSPVHWLIVGVIALVVLGPKKLPEVGRSLGSGLRGFRETLSGEDSAPAPHEPIVAATAMQQVAPAVDAVHQPVVVAEPVVVADSPARD
jgi:sec-independent protein translocase protein TatA